jgi:iron complex transport system ATP-binding protein
MSAPPLLAADRLAVGYRRRQRRQNVLTDLNLTVGRGDFVCLLGPNGTGKSTLLRTLAGLQRALAGRIDVDGVDIAAIRPFDRARLIGVVLSERISVGALRARQMVALGRYSHGGWNGRLTERDEEVVERALAAVGADHLGERDCRELSDGERQKLNLARALAQEPALIILDEPTAFLDVTARVELMALLRGLARREDLAVVASTHDLDLALRTADTVWLVDRDRRLRSGAPEDLILQGAFGDAFSSDNTRFESDSLRFDVRRDDAPAAMVKGPAPAAHLAATLLEREGFRVIADGEDAVLIVDVGAEGARWRAVDGDGELSGTSFAALAAFVRHAAATPQDATATRFNPANRSKG